MGYVTMKHFKALIATLPESIPPELDTTELRNDMARHCLAGLQRNNTVSACIRTVIEHNRSLTAAQEVRRLGLRIMVRPQDAQQNHMLASHPMTNMIMLCPLVLFGNDVKKLAKPEQDPVYLDFHLLLSSKCTIQVTSVFFDDSTKDAAGKAAVKRFLCNHCSLYSNRMNKCGGCGKVRYCSVECQRAQWKSHKGECKGK